MKEKFTENTISKTALNCRLICNQKEKKSQGNDNSTITYYWQ